VLPTAQSTDPTAAVTAVKQKRANRNYFTKTRLNPSTQSLVEVIFVLLYLFNRKLDNIIETAMIVRRALQRAADRLPAATRQWRRSNHHLFIRHLQQH
jgi:hypothetical protein